jgi:uncharacterized RDD family membrane protein YckC
MQDFDFIETPENVELQRPLAGIGTRFIAGLIDTLWLLLIYLAVFLAFILAVASTASLVALAASFWVLAMLIVVMFLVYWGYFVFFELRTNGQSPGKKSQRIRVVKDGGGPITFPEVAIRNLLRAVDGLGVYAVAGIVMFITRKCQRLGDLASGTVVVSEAVGDYRAKADRKRGGPQWSQAASPEALQQTGLTPQEYQILRSFDARREQLTLEARRRLALRLVQPILERVGQMPAGGTLEAVEARVGELLRGAAGGRPEGPP